MSIGYDILVIYPEDVRDNVAGTGMRSLEIAKSMARAGNRVGLTSTKGRNNISLIDVDVFNARHSEIVERAKCSRMLIVQGSVLNDIAGLIDIDTPIAVDFICPSLLETLEVIADENMIKNGWRRIGNSLAIIRASLLRADYFFCGSEKQQAWWLGHLAAMGRLNSETYPDIAHRFAIVPFGLSTTDSDSGSESVLHGYFGDALNNKTIFYWGGGIWPWLDLRTMVEGFIKAVESHTNIRMLLPSLDVTATGGQQSHSTYLKQVIHDHPEKVLHLPEWVPYHRIGKLLEEVDVGLSCHPETLESRFAIRTRCWDYFRSALPMIVSDGDLVSSWVEKHNMGLVVSPGDVDGWRIAFEKMDSPEYRTGISRNVQNFSESLTWDKVTIPLAEFATDPTRIKGISMTRRHGVPREWEKGARYQRRGVTLIMYGIEVWRIHGLKVFIASVLEWLGLSGKKSNYD